MSDGANETMTVTALLRAVEAIFRRAGLNDAQAGALARVITAGERDACKSHGLYRIEGVLRTIKAGKVDPRAEAHLHPSDGSAIVRVEARGGFTSPAFERGLPALAERTTALGVAALVINDGAHFSALWPEIEAVTAHGLAALALCPSYAAVAPAGGTKPLLGTNPFAFGWPRPGPYPYVFDFATSVAARGEIELKRRAGQALPEGWAIDDTGLPTTDPQAALDGSMLTFGGHKGSAISTMIELLAGVLIGDLTSIESLRQLGTTTLSPSHGELILAFAPERLAAGRPGDPLARAEALFEAMLGQGARLPSQRRFAARERALRDGVTLTAAEASQLRRFAEDGLDAVAI